MATKSILKSIVIKDKRNGSALINALESAKGKKATEVNFSRAVRTADDSMIQKMFGNTEKK